MKVKELIDHLNSMVERHGDESVVGFYIEGDEKRYDVNEIGVWGVTCEGSIRLIPSPSYDDFLDGKHPLDIEYPDDIAF